MLYPFVFGIPWAFAHIFRNMRMPTGFFIHLQRKGTFDRYIQGIPFEFPCAFVTGAAHISADQFSGAPAVVGAVRPFIGDFGDIAECVAADGYYRVGDIHTIDIAAAGEGFVADFLQTFGQIYIYQIRTSLECAVFNPYKTFKQIDFFQGTIGKCVFADVFQTFGEGCFRKVRTAFKGAFADADAAFTYGYRMDGIVTVKA